MPAFIGIQQNLDNESLLFQNQTLSEAILSPERDLISLSHLAYAKPHLTFFFSLLPGEKKLKCKKPKQTSSLHNPGYKKYIVLQLSLPCRVSLCCPLLLEIRLSFNFEELLDKHFKYFFP